MSSKRTFWIALDLILAMTVVACGTPQSAANPLPPTATLVPATTTAIPPTAIPTPTAIPLTNTPTLTALLSATPVDIPALSAPIDKLFQVKSKIGALSGAVLVTKKRQVILSQGYGLADHQQKIPNTTHTRFRIASLKKHFTVTTITSAARLDQMIAGAKSRPLGFPPGRRALRDRGGPLSLGQALYTGPLVPPKVLDALFATYVLMPHSGGWGYGYGWMIALAGRFDVSTCTRWCLSLRRPVERW